MDVASEKVAQLIVQAARQFTSVQQVIIFGSRAIGDNSERSDIDVAVFCPNADPQEWIAINDAISMVETLLKIDLVRLDQAAENFQNIIRQHGVIVYEKKN
jgi:predicted nucleotidyltransferase